MPDLLRFWALRDLFRDIRYPGHGLIVPDMDWWPSYFVTCQNPTPVLGRPSRFSSLSRINPHCPGYARYIEILSSTVLISWYSISGTWPDSPGNDLMTQLFCDLSKSYTSPLTTLEIQLLIPGKPSLSGIYPIYWDFELYWTYFVILDIRDEISRYFRHPWGYPLGSRQKYPF